MITGASTIEIYWNLVKSIEIYWNLLKSIEIYRIHWGYIGDSSASHLWLCQDSALSLVYPWNWRTHLSAFKDVGIFPPATQPANGENTWLKLRSSICFCPFPMILVVHVHKFWVVGCCRLITIPIEHGGQPLSLPSVQFPPWDPARLPKAFSTTLSQGSARACQYGPKSHGFVVIFFIKMVINRGMPHFWETFGILVTSHRDKSTQKHPTTSLIILGQHLSVQSNSS